MSKIVNADVIETLTTLNITNYFDVIIADPPYNINKNFGVGSDSVPLPDYIDWSKHWIDLCLKSLKPNGIMYIYGFTEILAHIAVNYPLGKQRFLIWSYLNKVAPNSKFWQRSHEAILCLWIDKKPALEIDQIREPYSKGYANAHGKERKSTKGRFGSKATVYNVNPLGAMPRDVIRVPALAGKSSERPFMCRTCGGVMYDSEYLKSHLGHSILQHPTQKPAELTKRLLLSAAKPTRGKVLIPFSGSGSECLVAKSLGFEFLGVELNWEYVTYAENLIRRNNGLASSVI
jgi:site-specific DNA-methyltransferase (adenine-specific)